MIDIANILDISPFSLYKKFKREMLNEHLQQLTRYHYEKCGSYRKLMDMMGLELNDLPEYDALPFLPVRLFKEYELRSIKKEEVVKTLTSSGTSGQQVSRIYLDKITSANQTKILTKIVSSFIGNKRIPMLILDSSSIIKDRTMFSARGAGIIGFSIFGSKKTYAFDNDMRLDIPQIREFLESHSGEPVFMFGFTFIIWQYFYKELIKNEYKPDFSKGILIHGGGWKKIVSESVSSQEFKQRLHEVCGIEINNIHDYYGMVEQTGTIYIECEYGNLHTSVFSDILIRHPNDFSLAEYGEKGLVELVSLLPVSYPGHILLTEDEGEILGEDDCPCGRLGKYFKIHGRIKGAEVRGCSDTYEPR